MPNPVEYAERTLKVHGVYEQAENLLVELDYAHENHVRALSALRAAREGLADRQAAVTITERATHADLSQTAFEANLKLVLQTDPETRGARFDLSNAQATVDQTESQVRRLERHLDVASARLIELGGLLTFFAARSK